jgi:hypothetical protein
MQWIGIMEVRVMRNYDIWKQRGQWRFVREGEDQPLESFQTKKAAIAFAEEYLATEGGCLRIWKGEDANSSLQVERDIGAESARGPEATPDQGADNQPQSLLDGIVEGTREATAMAWQALPQIGWQVSRGAYNAAYYTAYGIVFSAVTLGGLVPMRSPLAHGMHDGANAALHDYRETHPSGEAVTGAKAV